MLNLREFEAAARDRLDPAHADYFAGGAGDELTLRANEEAFARLRLLPRVLRGGGKQDLSVTLLNSRAALPIFLSPTAFHKLAHPEGEAATARAAAAAGAIMIASMAATTPVEEIAEAARAGSADGAPLWFQLYIQPDLEFTGSLVRRVEAAGCEALVVTVDSPARGAHERDLRHGFTDLPEGLRCENLRDPRTNRVLPIVMSPEITWWHVDWLRRTTSLPVVLKGVLHPEDARLAVRHGVAGLLLSNHGGRQLDGVPPTVELLPEIVAAVEGRIPVLLDGGVRRGTDVAKALALGAAAVGVGRPVLWGLAVAGERGVARVLDLLRQELDHTLTLLGVTGLPQLTPEYVRPSPAAGAYPKEAGR